MAGIGSGVGGAIAVANGSNNGTQYYAVGAQFATPTRSIGVKSAVGTYDPHIVQGGPYVRNGEIVDIGSANVAVYQDAKVAIQGDFVNSGMALLLAQALGGYGTQAELIASASTPAYVLCALGAQVTAPYAALNAQDGFWFDMEVKVKQTDGTAEYQDYHSCKITKAEFVFPRNNIVTYNYEVDAAYVGLSGSTSVTYTEAAKPVPFTMPNASSLFQMWNGSALVAIDGCRQATVTITPALSTERIYIGNVYKDEPLTNNKYEIAVALEMDYTPGAQSAIFSQFLTHGEFGYGSGIVNGAQGIQGATTIMAVGNQIAASGVYDTFGFQFPQLWLMSGGEAPLAGVDIIKNTVMLKGTLNGFNAAGLYATLFTADTGA